MSVLFVHDHRFKYKNNKYFSSGGIGNNKTFNRYISIFGTMRIISRINSIENISELLEINNKFVEIKGETTIGKTIPILKSEIKKSRHLIVRMPSFLGIKAIQYAKKYKKKYLIELVGCPWDALWNHSYKGKLIAPFIYYLTKKYINNAEYVIYVTEKFLQKKYPTTGQNTNCSNVLINDFDESILKLRLKKINIKKRNMIIGTIGAVNIKYKGQQFIIEALGSLKKKGIINFEYHLVGNGDNSYLKNTARKYNVSEQVVFVGGLPHQEIFNWLDKTVDLYVQPSRQEGLPRALIEAMSRALPAFGSKTAGIPELLDKQFIFSNTNSNIQEIEEILKLFDQQKMIEQAIRNFEEAKKYQANIIEKRRKKILNEFKNVT